MLFRPYYTSSFCLVSFDTQVSVSLATSVSWYIAISVSRNLVARLWTFSITIPCFLCRVPDLICIFQRRANNSFVERRDCFSVKLLGTHVKKSEHCGWFFHYAGSVLVEVQVFISSDSQLLFVSHIVQNFAM